MDIKAKLRGIKRYGYDFNFEEKQLNKIKIELGLKGGDIIAKRISSVGIKTIKGITEHDLFMEAEQERIKQFEAKANINNSESLLN
jgi:hypothetical protein